jgi:pimeloyl-ACP methyl ester carboxylesterase
MCGALDQTTPPALAREVASAIPNAIYREIEDSGHCPMLEQPEALVALIESFTRAGMAPSVASPGRA